MRRGWRPPRTRERFFVVRRDRGWWRRGMGGVAGVCRCGMNLRRVLMRRIVGRILGARGGWQQHRAHHPSEAWTHDALLKNRPQEIPRLARMTLQTEVKLGDSRARWGKCQLRQSTEKLFRKKSAVWITWFWDGDELPVARRTARIDWLRHAKLDAPAVLLGGAQIVAEFFADLIEEYRAGNNLFGILGDIRGSESAQQHPIDAALDPVRFGAKAK